MICIRIGEPDRLKNNVLVKASAFVSFDYDTRIVDFIRNMSTRVWVAENKCWEMPLQNIVSLCNKFEDEEIKISGVYETISKQEMEGVIPEGYTFKTKPFAHQLDGIKFGLSKKKFLLCDDQGLGKHSKL